MSTELSEKYEEEGKKFQTGDYLMIKDYHILGRATDELEEGCSRHKCVIFIKKYRWTRHMEMDEETAKEEEHGKGHRSEDTFLCVQDLVQVGGYAALIVTQQKVTPHGRIYYQEKNMHEREKDVEEMDLAMDWEECECVWGYGYRRCICDVFPLEWVDEEAIFGYVKEKHGFGETASHWKDLRQEEKRECLFWWYAMNVLNAAGSEKDLPK